MLGVEVLGSHGEDETVFLAFEAGGVISAVGVDHAFGEGAGVHQFGERGGEVVVLFLEAMLCAEDNAHVGEGGGFRVRAGRVAGKFWLIGCGRSLGGLARNRHRQGGRGDCATSYDRHETRGTDSHAELFSGTGAAESVRQFSLHFTAKELLNFSLSCYSRN